MTADRPVWQRRAMLVGGVAAVLAWVKGAPHLLSLGGSDFEFEDISALPPFRRLVGTRPISAASPALVGIDVPTSKPAQEVRLQDRVRANPCLAIFGAPEVGPVPATVPATVPVAMFSDFACPICALMNRRLSELQEAAPDRFRILRHELPLLGAGSAMASRAVLAAQLQGGYLEMHARLSRTPAITDEAAVVRIAGRIGLDGARLLRDMRSAEIEQKLRMSRAIADVFGFYGTPAFAVGRTVFLGQISKTSLRDLIALEAESGCQGV